MLVFGFKLGKLQKGKQPVVTTAFNDAAKLIESANAKAIASNRTTWLGSGTSAKDAENATGLMVKFFEKTKVVIDTASAEGAGANSFAFCNADKFRGENKTPLQDHSSSWKNQCNVFLGPNFFHEKVSRGERAQSLIHEFTHLALATTDEKFATGDKKGKDCYGADYCIDLATKEPSKARKNADNWGFYFVAYRTGLGWTGDEQKYLTAKECAAARGKRFN